MTPSKQVEAVKAFIAGLTGPVKHTAVLELIANLNGAKSYNQLSVRSIANPESGLSQDGPTDFRIKPGYHSTWISAGNIAVYIRKTDKGVAVDLYPIGKEADSGWLDPTLASAYLRYQVAERKGAPAFDLSKEKPEKGLRVKSDLMQQACLELLTAYAKNEDGSGSIDWDDIDKAVNTAKAAFGSRFYKRLVAKVES